MRENRVIVVVITLILTTAITRQANAAPFLIPLLIGGAKSTAVAVGTKAAVVKGAAAAGRAVSKPLAAQKGALSRNVDGALNGMSRQVLSPTSIAVTRPSQSRFALSSLTINLGLFVAPSIADAYDWLSEAGLQEEPNDPIRSDLVKAQHGDAEFMVRACVDPQTQKTFVAPTGWKICPYTGDALATYGAIRFQQ